MRPFAAVLAVGFCGCASSMTAIVDGNVVPRLNLTFTGQPYSIDHRRAHPQPGGPSHGLKDDGGEIAGHVCGMDALFTVEHDGDRVQLTGFVDGGNPASIAVADTGGARNITGNVGHLGIDLRITPTTLQGHAGLRVFSLERVNQGDPKTDLMIGFMRVPHWSGVFRVVVRHPQAFWEMPAADQALVLPLILMCYIAADENATGGPIALDVGFGGPAGAQPSKTSALYRR